MSDSSSMQAVESWEIMLLSREKMGVKELQKIFSLGHGQINRYCRNPNSADVQRNPIDRLRLMFELLVEHGEEELVRTALNIMAETIDCRVQPIARPKPDKDTIEEECLDDFPELTELDRLIGRREHPRTVSRQADKVKREVDETIVRYMELWDKHYGH